MKLFEVLNYSKHFKDLNETVSRAIIDWNFKNEKSVDGKTLPELIEEFAKLNKVIEQLSIELRPQMAEYENTEICCELLRRETQLLKLVCDRISHLHNSDKESVELNFSFDELNNLKDTKQRALLQAENDFNELKNTEINLSEPLLLAIGEYCG